ncbi:YdeI/OmpD-associated family protein [Flavobacterium filum]|uniref:YdeI/OmpD-associated family protein n=1 Tax=Flavobacterium filum TaxID=370974 RepID=UPI0023F07E58|nr:YdeI/OmpD-associated family protein [Flavobacterium filum]
MSINEKTNIETFCPTNRIDWRKWLKKNHQTKQSVWLVCYTKKSNQPTVNWSETVDEALCFGWIDSTRKTIDEFSFMQFFSKRKPNSTWSKINKEKVQKLIDNGLMSQAGLDIIETAKQNGSWTILDEVEELKIPNDLEKAFKKHKGSKDYFLSLSKTVRKMMLQWLVLAKRPETRQKRINEIAEQAGQNKKPKQF